MTRLAKRLERVEAQAAAVSPTDTMTVTEIRARLAEVRAALSRAWGLPVDAGIDDFCSRLSTVDNPVAFKALALTRQLANAGAL